MVYYLAPIVIVFFYMGFFAIENVHIQQTKMSHAELTAKNEGQIFIEYRDAVASYLQNNPTFTGTVSAATLTAQGYQFPSNFLDVTSNEITQIGSGSGRVITCFSDLPRGALVQALRITDNDASLGIASSTNWTSAAYGSNTTPVALSTTVTVPEGNVVSVIQIGS